MDHKTMNTGGDRVMDDQMTNAGGHTTMNGTRANDGGHATMNNKVAKKTGGLGEGVLWLGATALAIVGAKYAWQRARQSLRNTNPKYVETAERMIDSVVDGSITN